MKVRIDYIRPLPDNIILYEDFYVIDYAISNDIYYEILPEAWEGGFINSLWACFDREFPMMSNRE